MHEQPQIEELANAASGGLLAEEVVVATTGLLEGRRIETDEERRALETAKAVLEVLRDPPEDAPRAPTMRQLAGDGALDVLHAALVQAPENVQVYLRELTEVLDAALTDEDVSDRHRQLESIRDVFATFGQMTLARANSLSRAPQERLNWPTSPATSSS